MRIAAFVADEQALGSAGVRIRYDRLRPDLSRAGHVLQVRVADGGLAEAHLAVDHAIITKIYDGRAVALARRLRAGGARVGIDVFDDYFSQTEDARFTALRGWLAQLAPHLDFALCATQPMRERLARLLPGLPVHVVNDPHDRLDEAEIAASVEEATARARRDRVIRIAWFGIGDSREFQVGLDDVAAFGPHLSAFARRGWSAQLRVLTNPRAMTVERLEGLARLPIPHEVEEWSLPRQEALLRWSLLTFLPVNAQAFSTVKSMNRAVSALLGGSQVLSVGYPLYAPFEAMIYRNAEAILDDLEDDRLRLRRDSLPVLTGLLARAGDPAIEAAGLAAFLVARQAPVPVASGPLVVAHGCKSAGVVHKTLGQLGALSAAHPFLPAPRFNPDLALIPSPAGPVAELSARGLDQLRPELRAMALPAGKARFRLALPELALMGQGAGLAADPGSRTGLLGQLAGYERGLALLRAVSRRLFGAEEMVVSERAAPFGAVHRPKAPEA